MRLLSSILTLSILALVTAQDSSSPIHSTAATSDSIQRKAPGTADDLTEKSLSAASDVTPSLGELHAITGTQQADLRLLLNTGESRGPLAGSISLSWAPGSPN
ncbi:hypothetical protein DFH09DRAFT_1185147 [Mycena vulgaris]|nr:hypothetical protein DFH09DRAFT_1185147 [Mycena vulgaris]